MGRAYPLTKNRESIYNLLTRAKRFHCPISAVYDLDMTALCAAVDWARGAGRPVGLAACLVRATSLVLEKFPRMNRHLFHGLLRKFEWEFDGIHCNLVVMRATEDGRRVLFPLVLRDSNRRSLEEIHAEIERVKTAPLAELPEYARLARLERLPRLALRYASFKTRSDPRFYERYFGTYGLSSLVKRGFGPTSGHGVANTGSSFFPGPIAERPVVVDGAVRPRLTMPMMVVVDHYLLDGHDMLDAMTALRDLIENPTALGLDAGAPRPAGAP